MSQAKSPKTRPTWLLALASAMLLFGGLTLVGGLFTFRDPKAIATLALRSSGRVAIQPDVAQKLSAIDGEILDRHGRGVRINALGGIAFGLYTLYAVSAILSRDRHGRTLALGVAGAGLLYQLGGLPMAISMAREAATASTPVLVDAVADKGIAPAEVAREVRSSFVRPPLVYAALGIGWCALIVAYFGGRRGRVAYGLEPGRR